MSSAINTIMKIPPSYTITPQILELISKIEANRFYLSSINIPLPLKEKIQRISTLKSSLFSARIEGNPLTLEQIHHETSDRQKKQEVFNILRAIEFIEKDLDTKDKITKKMLLSLHSIVMDGLPSEKGLFRQDVSAIFNNSGVAVYIPPPPDKILQYLSAMLEYINSDYENFPLLNAFVSHLIFEKIHPFLDGNGRVGRLLVFAILKSKSKIYSVFIPFEEYLDTHKSSYYYFLDKGFLDMENYLLFMLKAFLAQAEKVRKSMEDELAKKETMFLPPRQEEILNIIKDHGFVSFDIIRRRFLKVPERTLRYDIKKLLDMGIVVKTGKTKGSYYRAKG